MIKTLRTSPLALKVRLPLLTKREEHVNFLLLLTFTYSYLLYFIRKGINDPIAKTKSYINGRKPFTLKKNNLFSAMTSPIFEIWRKRSFHSIVNITKKEKISLFVKTHASYLSKIKKQNNYIVSCIIFQIQKPKNIYLEKCEIILHDRSSHTIGLALPVLSPKPF